MMKTRSKPVFLLLPLLALLAVHPFQTTIAQPVSISPTPTYDPLAEPPLPSHPTEYELGRNLYWHWCMTCHGDGGQGLTDEFRGVWEPEHQNCWARGCHSGRPGDPGFPIPTIVPAVVSENHLARFSSQEELAAFLRATHPPQSPGILKSEEYQAIALFVFTMNGRAPGNISVTSTTASTPTLSPHQEDVSSSLSMSIVILLIAAALIIFVFIRRKSYSQK